MNPLVIDERWTGQHGIGRYSAEILPRLDLPWTPLGLTGSPSSPRDAFVPRRVSRGQTIYSPGYNAAIGGSRQLVTVHDLTHLRLNSNKRLAYGVYYNRILRPVVRRAGTVFTVSQSSAREVSEWLADDSVEIIVTGAGCSAAFTPQREDVQTYPPRLVSVGNMRAHKNLLTLLDALRLVPDVQSAVIVPASERSELEREVASRGLQGRVTAHSGISDEELASLYQRAQVSVMPSLMEGFGLPALESVRSGTPVIYYAGCSSVAEIVDGNGIAVEGAHDAEEWAAAIRTAVTEPYRVDYPADRYTWESSATVIREALQRLA